MNKTLLIPVLLSCATLLAQKPETSAQKKQDAKTKAYDADLFRKDVEVVSTHLEFLYWTVRENNLDYAIQMKRPAWGPSDSFAQGEYKTAKFEWDPGFRVAMSYYNAPKMWEIYLQYTWLHSRGSQSSRAPKESNRFLDATWPQVFTDALASADTHLNFHYNVFDYTAARVFQPNPHLRIRFLGGLVGTLLNQNWKFNYSDSLLHQTSYRNNWDFWGAGIRIGTNIDWYVHGDFFLTGRATTGILLGRYHNHAFQKTTFAPTPSDDTSVPIRDAYYEDTRTAYTVQFTLGPSYQKRLNGCRLEIFAGYEFNAWFNVLEVFRSEGASPSLPKETRINTGNLSLDGLTARVTLDF